MANENTSNTKKSTNPGKAGQTSNAASMPTPRPSTPAASTGTSNSPSSAGSRKKGKSKNTRPQIGGTAVAGAKSTLPKPPPQSNDPAKQQMESYNRVMRRRMEHIGAGPQSQEERMAKLRNRRQKRIERSKERRAQAQQELKQKMPDFNRRNLYFFLAVAVLVVIIIIVFIILHQLHVVG
jgi:uncharacterized protein YaiL (DUF2058 family)